MEHFYQISFSFCLRVRIMTIYILLLFIEMDGFSMFAIMCASVPVCLCRKESVSSVLVIVIVRPATKQTH